jgi:hypothetical protein
MLNTANIARAKTDSYVWQCLAVVIYTTGKHDPCRDSAIGIATDYRLDDRGVAVRVPVESKLFSSTRRWTQSRSEVHPTSCPMGTGDSFSGGKAARA